MGLPGRRGLRVRVRFAGVGPESPAAGSPTQLAVFTRAGRPHRRPARDSGVPRERELSIPELSLVVLVGVTGSGKSTFARAHFKPTEVISSDFCRGLVADDENDQSATPDAFDVLHYIAGKRLAAGRLTVVDATSVQPEARAPLVALAREHDVLPVAIVLDLPASVCEARNARAARPRLRRARDQAAARRAAQVGAEPAARGVPRGARAAVRGRGRRGDGARAPGCSATCGTRPGRST